MNVLSLFDGMSCGQQALERAGIKVENYFASEIDKYANIVNDKNYPDTIQLGDVTKIDTKLLPKIDLLIGGSPCTGFSFIGNGSNFEHPESKLFFEFVRILNEIKPKYFLLENIFFASFDQANFALLFAVSYVVLYRRVVLFKAPKWLRVSGKR